jgi:hypothetical protein
MTCDRCPVQNCAERMAPPTLLERIQERKKVEETLRNITE